MEPVKALAFFLLIGCGRETWRNADLQLDILDQLPAEAEQVRVCITEVGMRTMGAGGDRYAVPGLPKDVSHEVTVDALRIASSDTSVSDGGSEEVLLRAGPVWFDAENVYQCVEATWIADEATLESETGSEALKPCTANGQFAPEDEESWLFAVRFSE